MARKEEYKYKYAIIGNNIYSYFLKEMLGDKAIVLSNKQPFYLYSFDYMIFPTDNIMKFFEFYEIPYRLINVKIGSVNRRKKKEEFNKILRKIGINLPYELDDPSEVEIIIPIDYTNKFYVDYKIDEINIRKNEFRIYVNGYKKVYVVENIINTMFLGEFLNLIPQLKHLKEYYKVKTYKRVSYFAYDITNLEYKFGNEDIIVDYNQLEFDVYRRMGFVVIADIIETPNRYKNRKKYRVIEEQKNYKFEKEFNKNKLIEGIYLEGRYAQVKNYLNFEDFILSIQSKFEEDCKYV